MKYLYLSFICFCGMICFAQNHYLNFDGANDFVQIEHTSNLDFAEDFTIEIKFKRERSGVREDLMDKKSLIPYPTSHNDIAIVLETSNKVVLWFRENVYNTVLLTSTTVINEGEWVHVTSVRQGNTVKLYINGVQEASAFFNGDLTSNGPLRLGSNRTEIVNPNAAPVFNYKGGIDEFRIWNVAKSTSEITEKMDIELAGDEVGLVAYYNFNHGKACGSNLIVNTVNDIAGSENGFLKNFDLTGLLADPCESNWVKVNERNLEIDKVEKFDFILYPNPVNGLLKFEITYFIPFNSIIISDYTGKIVFEIDINKLINNEIDVSELDSGLYLIHFRQNDVIIGTKNFVKI